MKGGICGLGPDGVMVRGVALSERRRIALFACLVCLYLSSSMSCLSVCLSCFLFVCVARCLVLLLMLYTCFEIHPMALYMYV